MPGRGNGRTSTPTMVASLSADAVAPKSPSVSPAPRSMRPGIRFPPCWSGHDDVRVGQSAAAQYRDSPSRTRGLRNRAIEAGGRQTETGRAARPQPASGNHSRQAISSSVLTARAGATAATGRCDTGGQGHRRTEAPRIPTSSRAATVRLWPRQTRGAVRLRLSGQVPAVSSRPHFAQASSTILANAS